jgi:hypothetical protein
LIDASKKRLSATTLLITAIVTNAPRSAVRRTIRSGPARSSAAPAKISYAGEAPMNVHRKPIGDDGPYVCTRRSSDGGGNCAGMTFWMPYHSIAAPTKKRR